MTLDAQRRDQLLDAMARRIKQLGVTAPAILFFETYKPLAFLGAQLLWVAQPFLSFGFAAGAADLRDFILIIEDRAGVEALIQRLELLRTDDSAPHVHQRT